MTVERKVWLAFVSLAIIWGMSFLFIKVALDTLQPVTLVSIRLAVGLLGLLVIMRWRGIPMPRERRLWQHLAVMGVVNVAVPFILITWAESGEQGIDSGLASVLNSTVPLFSVFISGFMLRAETVTIATVGGLFIGFGGVILLVGPAAGSSTGELTPYLAVVAAALCYAVASAYARRYLRGRSPEAVSAGQILVAVIIVSVLAGLLEDLNAQSLTLATTAALLWLGLLGSCAAYVFYFFILQEWGATRTTLVTYLIPIVGVTAGVLLLDEALEWQVLVGGGLILAGVAVVNRWRSGSRVLVTARVK